MTRLGAILDVDLLQRHIADGNVAVKQHDELPLKLLTYTRQAQYSQAWDDVTIRTRGLVVESRPGTEVSAMDQVVAQPFFKFFNYGEHLAGKPYAKAIPDGTFEVYNKVDGSLAIIFNYQNRWYVATRGSFTSEQARWAQNRLDTRSHATERLDESLTYLAEIIYPENRIVVDYEGKTDLVLLGAQYRSTLMGGYIDLTQVSWAWGGLGSVVHRYPPMTLRELLEHAENNTAIDHFGSGEVKVKGTELEGFVLVWKDGTRVKIKYAEYVHLHALMTGLRTVDVWRAVGAELFVHRGMDITAKQAGQVLGCSAEEAAVLISGQAFSNMLEAIPDEVEDTVKELAWQYSDTARQFHEVLERLWFSATEEIKADRAKYADWAKSVSHGLSNSVRSALFLMLDGDEDKLVRHIWKSIKPNSEPVFKENVDAD